MQRASASLRVKSSSSSTTFRRCAHRSNSGGGEFLAALDTHRQDCAVLDLHMPDVTGFDVLSGFVTLGTFLQRQLCLSFISHFKMAVSDATGRNAQIEYITSIKRLLTFLDGIGSVGALFAAIAAPCCFPLFAGVITAVGVVALGKSEGFALYAFQGFGLLSLLGLALAVRQHRSPFPFVLGVTSVAALAWSFYGTFSHLALYGGLFGLLAATSGTVF